MAAKFPADAELEEGSSFKFNMTHRSSIPPCKLGSKCTDLSCSQIHNYKYCQEFMNGTPQKCPKKEECRFLRVSRGEWAHYLTTGIKTDNFKSEVVRTAQIGGICRDYALTGRCSSWTKFKRECIFTHLTVQRKKTIVDDNDENLIRCHICTEIIKKGDLSIFVPCRHAACFSCGNKLYEDSLRREVGHMPLYHVWLEWDRRCPFCKAHFQKVVRIA